MGASSFCQRDGRARRAARGGALGAKQGWRWRDGAPPPLAAHLRRPSLSTSALALALFLRSLGPPSSCPRRRGREGGEDEGGASGRAREAGTARAGRGVLPLAVTLNHARFPSDRLRQSPSRERSRGVSAALPSPPQPPSHARRRRRGKVGGPGAPGRTPPERARRAGPNRALSPVSSLPSVLLPFLSLTLILLT